MIQFSRYLKGSPGVYNVVGLVIKRMTKYGYFPCEMKITDNQSLKIKQILVTLPQYILIPEMIRRYFKEKPSEYKVLGYTLRATETNNAQIKFSDINTPLNVLPLLNDMVRVAI